MSSGNRSKPRLHIKPLTFEQACAYVNAVHRHHKAPRGHKFSLGVFTTDGVQVGAAIVGRPVARAFDNGSTLEVTRVATDGTPNACSALYGAIWGGAKRFGYLRVITYTQQGEDGASLRAVGWRQVTQLRARPGWDAPSRPRASRGTDNIVRFLWEITATDAPELPPSCEETRDETPRHKTTRKCAQCSARLIISTTGRPPAYCSRACQQRAYRERKQNKTSNTTPGKG